MTVRTGERVRSRPDADAVVIATGGFERDGELARAFLRGPMLAPVGAPGAQGDGLRLAMGAGAALGCMSEAWWCPAISIPGETIDGAPMFRLILTERAAAGLADRRLARPPLRQRGPELQRPRARAAGLRPRALRLPPRPGVADLRRRPTARRTGSARSAAATRTPSGWRAAPDLAGLAQQIDVAPDDARGDRRALQRRRRAREDPDFGRGSYPYDRFIGEVGPLERGPYYALRVLPGCLSTKGGPRTDADGRVLGIEDGAPIDGLYAAGNAAASAFGLAYPGAGGTLGPALVFGLRAGDAAAAD